MKWVLFRVIAFVAAVLIFVSLLLIAVSNEEAMRSFVSLILSQSPMLTAYENTVLPHVLSLVLFISALFSFGVYQAFTDLFLQGSVKKKGMVDLFVSREELKELYEYSPMPYLVLNEKGKIERPNAAALRLFKTTRDKLEGADLASFVPSENQEEYKSALERFRRNIAVRDKEIVIQRSDGVPRYVKIAIFPHKVPGEGLSGFTALVDITDQKEIDKAKTEFVSLASHQLRAPLTALSWYTEALMKEDGQGLDEKQREYLSKIEKRNKEMIDLVETLLNISRIEVGRISISKEQVDITDLVKNVTEELETEIERKNMQYSAVYPEGESIVISTDPKLLRIVIQNLLSNAIKYTPDGGSVKIKIEDMGAELAIRVSDSGYGIPPEAHDKIFTKMFRADNIKTKDVKGTGLGLYMTQSFVELLGGKISFESEVDKGTTFTVNLPKN